jgi:hypothetical protein
MRHREKRLVAFELPPSLPPFQTPPLLPCPRSSSLFKKTCLVRGSAGENAGIGAVKGRASVPEASIPQRRQLHAALLSVVLQHCKHTRFGSAPDRDSDEISDVEISSSTEVTHQSSPKSQAGEERRSRADAGSIGECIWHHGPRTPSITRDCQPIRPRPPANSLTVTPKHAHATHFHSRPRVANIYFQNGGPPSSEVPNAWRYAAVIGLCKAESR